MLFEKPVHVSMIKFGEKTEHDEGVFFNYDLLPSPFLLISHGEEHFDVQVDILEQTIFA